MCCTETVATASIGGIGSFRDTPLWGRQASQLTVLFCIVMPISHPPSSSHWRLRLLWKDPENRHQQQAQAGAHGQDASASQVARTYIFWCAAIVQAVQRKRFMPVFKVHLLTRTNQNNGNA